MKIGICKFCGKEKELIKSHIIPKCLLGIKNNGRLVNVNGQKKRIDVNPIHQNGVKEYLLCSDCDNKLGYYDCHVNNLLNIEVPKLKADRNLNGTICRSLTSDKFDIDRLHKFFISLLWRMSICSTPIPLGKYQEIAFKILKGDIPDNYNIFIPLIYRRVTGGHVDDTIFFGRRKYLGKHAYILRFPGYEVIIIINTENSTNKSDMEINKQQFSKDEVLIIDITKNTPFDYRLVKQLFECRDNTPGLKRPTID